MGLSTSSGHPFLSQASRGIQTPGKQEATLISPLGAEFSCLYLCLASLSPPVPHIHPQASGTSSSLMMVSRPPKWPQEPSGHLALTQGPLGGLGRLRLQLFPSKWVGWGIEVRVPRPREKEVEQCLGGGIPILPGPAPVTYPLSALTPLVHEPLPPPSPRTNQVPTLSPSAEPRRLRTPRPVLGRWGAPWIQQHPQTSRAVVQRPCSLPFFSLQHCLLDKPGRLHGLAVPSVKGDLSPLPPSTSREKGDSVILSPALVS